MKKALYDLAKTCGADLMSVAPAARFAPDHKIFRIYPETKSVVAFAFRCLRGSYRGTEEGTTYYQYTTMSVENIEETVMPVALVRLANRMANRAQKTGRRVSLEPMNPYERRILHSALQDHPAVTTHSEGEEPNRHVVITLK